MFKKILASVVACAIAITLRPIEVPAQSHLNETAFSRIEVKPAHSTDGQNQRLRVLPSGNLIGTSVSVITLISEGYRVPANPSDRLLGLSPWLYGERYDIEATARPSAKYKSFSDSMRDVLINRFHLVMRTETKSMSAYALVVDGSRPALKQSTSENCIFDTAPEGCHTFVIGFGHPLNGRAVDMDDLAHYIENWTDRPVVNRTSLAGIFAMNSDGWRPMRLPPPPPGGTGNVDFTHLQTIDAVLAKVGLKLQKVDATLPSYTVEQISHP